MTLNKGLQIYLVTTRVTTNYDFQQLISDPTHFFPKSSSCNDLIFTYQPNLMVDSGVHPTLHTNSHHKIIYCTVAPYPVHLI